MKVSVDTNILIYSVDPNDRVKQALAGEVLRRLAQGQSALIEQCLFEFLHATSRKLGVPLGLCVATVTGWISTFDVVLPAPDIVLSATKLLALHKLSVWDARMLAVCEASGINILLTEDLQDGGKYGSVTALNPFNPANTRILHALLPP